jgi:nucleoside-diphosphate kinase
LPGTIDPRKIAYLHVAGRSEPAFYSTHSKEKYMSVEQTLSIIKPDGVQKNLIGEIVGRFEKAGLEIVAARMMHLSREQAEGFYAVHKERPFFNDLVSYMTSGPVMVQALQGESAINVNREIMGAESIEQNVVHGSDGPDTAAVEIAFFFAGDDICKRTR